MEYHYSTYYVGASPFHFPFDTGLNCIRTVFDVANAFTKKRHDVIPSHCTSCAFYAQIFEYSLVYFEQPQQPILLQPLLLQQHRHLHQLLLQT